MSVSGRNARANRQDGEKAVNVGGWQQGCQPVAGNRGRPRPEPRTRKTKTRTDPETKLACALSGDIVFLANSGHPVGFATVRTCPPADLR